MDQREKWAGGGGGGGGGERDDKNKCAEVIQGINFIASQLNVKFTYIFAVLPSSPI